MAECQSLATNTQFSPGPKGRVRTASMHASEKTRKRFGLST